MTQHYWIVFAMVLMVYILETASLPAQPESVTENYLDATSELTIIKNSRQSKEERLFLENQIKHVNKDSEETKEILDKILSVNKGLTNQRKHDTTTNTKRNHEVLKVDKNTLDIISKLFATGKLQSFLSHIKDVDNSISSDFDRLDNSRGLNSYGDYSQSMILHNPAINPTSMPYVVNLPVVLLPQQNYNNMYGGYPMYNDLINNQEFGPSMSIKPKDGLFPNIPFLNNLPSFSLPWPLAPLFPILIKDPLVGFLQGGGLNNFIEYGQQADVCSRKQKSVESYNTDNIHEEEDNVNDAETSGDESNYSNVRKSRSIKKRTTEAIIPPQGTSKKIKKVYLTKPVTTKSPVLQNEEENHTKYEDGNADLRFPFGDFGWFGNKKPVAPSPGFFINKLRVRKGGVAIAGPGGVATAGRGGTAIVGPGGFAYTKPGSLAVAGPAARIFALSPDADLNDIVSRIQTQTDSGRSLSDTIPEGKLLATGPIVFYHPNKTTYDRIDWFSRRKLTDKSNIRGIKDRLNKQPLNYEEIRNYNIFLRPVAHAISPYGMAVANPVSRLLIGQDTSGTLNYEPVAAAVAGPGGIAHAESDLYIYEYTTDINDLYNYGLA